MGRHNYRTEAIVMAKNKPLKLRYETNKFAKFQRAQTELFLNLLVKKYNKVLEVGCGKGYFSYLGALHKKFINCYGCDIFRDYQIEEIQEYAKSVAYEQIENNNLLFADNSFDLVFSMDVIEHIDDDIKFIKENIRVCKKGGEIIIGTPNHLRITNLFLMLLRQLKFPRDMGKDTYGNCIHIREYKVNDLVEKIVRTSNEKISHNKIKVYPCWFGILSLNLGINKLPLFLGKFCHFFFIKFTKTW